MLNTLPKSVTKKSKLVAGKEGKITAQPLTKYDRNFMDTLSNPEDVDVLPVFEDKGCLQEFCVSLNIEGASPIKVNKCRTSCMKSWDRKLCTDVSSKPLTQATPNAQSCLERCVNVIDILKKVENHYVQKASKMRPDHIVKMLNTGEPVKLVEIAWQASVDPNAKPATVHRTLKDEQGAIAVIVDLQCSPNSQ